MRLQQLSLIVLIAGMTLFAFNQLRVKARLQTALAGRDQLNQQQAAQKARVDQLEAELRETRTKLVAAEMDRATFEARLNGMNAKVAELERQMQVLGQTGARRPGLSQLASNQARDPADPNATAALKGRSWGPEQLTGPPDTVGSGDIPTAWASREPDAGPEWLKLDYQNPISLAEVRIRETYNPGAISKVTAIQNGQEILLWEGTELPAQAPIDFVLPVSGNIIAQSITVYLDTSRVSGWNEIDAVELVGKDGTRQWASQAAASSTYAALR
jgi:hypothetical protein